MGHAGGIIYSDNKALSHHEKQIYGGQIRENFRGRQESQLKALSQRHAW